MEKIPTPLARRVLIEIDKVEEKEFDGIIRPETRTELPQIGTVVRVGQAGDIPFDVEVGDKVSIPGTGHSRVKANDREFVLIDESQILAVIYE